MSTQFQVCSLEGCRYSMTRVSKTVQRTYHTPPNMPICSMYGIFTVPTFTYIYHKHQRNVGRHKKNMDSMGCMMMSEKHFLSLNPPCKPECTAGITSHVPFSSLINLI